VKDGLGLFLLPTNFFDKNFAEQKNIRTFAPAIQGVPDVSG
jgi:hypothetical protein